MKTITRYGHSVHKEGSLPLGTYASHIILTKGTTLVNMIIIKCEKWQICIEISAGTLLWIYWRLIGRSYIALARQDKKSTIYRIHSEDSDFDYFGICLQCCICISKHSYRYSKEVKEKRKFCA